ncbi:MAG: acyl-CoA dehydrogenase, partial [Myxococcota bacterium]
PDKGRRGITAFYVPADAPGLVTEAIEMSGDHPVGRLIFTDCVLPAESLIGEVGGGFKLAMQTLDTFRVTVGAAAVGMARRALDEALAHVKQRHQFGKALIEQQLVAGHIADMTVELDAARLLVYRAAWLKDRDGDRHTLPVSVAKLHATEAASRIIDTAVQLFGGLGVTRNHIVERLYREIRPLRIYEGTSEIQRLIIARELNR